MVDDIDIAGKYIGVSFTPFNFDSEEHQVRATQYLTRRLESRLRITFAHELTVL